MTNAVESCKSTVCTTETNFYKQLHQNRNASILSTETHCAASSLGCRRFVLRPKYPSLATLLSLSRRGCSICSCAFGCRLAVMSDFSSQIAKLLFFFNLHRKISSSFLIISLFARDQITLILKAHSLTFPGNNSNINAGHQPPAFPDFSPLGILIHSLTGICFWVTSLDLLPGNRRNNPHNYPPGKFLLYTNRKALIHMQAGTRWDFSSAGRTRSCARPRPGTRSYAWPRPRTRSCASCRWEIPSFLVHGQGLAQDLVCPADEKSI